MSGSLDSLIGVLRTGLAGLPHAKRINLIVLSDHGMTEVDAVALQLYS
ncbi:MAG: alkaline phosphatase family protein [Marinilabiliales bacterium]|nr:alkaline phosphatase family protein [Marinilabiliales bacterium]